MLRKHQINKLDGYKACLQASGGGEDLLDSFFFFFFFINDRGWEQTYEVDPWQIGLPSSFLQPPPPLKLCDFS